MKRLAALAPLLALIVIAAASIYVLTRGQERAAPFEPPANARAAPAYELSRLGGGEAVTPEAFAGRPYVINLFASWCAPCRVEWPLLMRLKDEGAVVLGVAYKDAPPAAQQLIAQLGDPFSSVALDPEGRFGLDLGVTAVPETYVVSADGHIIAAHRGPLDARALEQVILPALRAE